MPLLASKLPPEFVERLRRILPGSRADKALRALQGERLTTFRLNSLKTGPRVLREALDRNGFKTESPPWLPGAFILRKGRQRDLERLPLYEEGWIYMQNLSSMIPPLALEAGPGQEVLDLAAAPGSKASQIASLMGNQGRVVAVEKDAVRTEKLRATLSRQGATCVEVVQADGIFWGKSHPSLFDRVLLDAPCSAEGRFDLQQPSSFKYWKPQVVVQNAKLQRRLIASAVEALKPGGVLVYSTCTFAPEENEAVVQHALDLAPGALTLEALPLEIPQGSPGLRAWGDQVFHPDMRKTLRVLPGETLEGFFVARLRKLIPSPISGAGQGEGKDTGG